MVMKAPTPLRLAIAASGITQRNLADQIGLDETRLSRIVNGMQCDQATCQDIAKALGREKTELWPVDEEIKAALDDEAEAA